MDKSEREVLDILKLHKGTQCFYTLEAYLNIKRDKVVRRLADAVDNCDIFRAQGELKFLESFLKDLNSTAKEQKDRG